MAPAETREPGVVAVSGNPLRAGFYRQSREIGVRDQTTFCTDGFAEPGKNVPMTGTGKHRNTGRVLTKVAGVLQCFFQSRRLSKNAGMRENADNAAQDQLGNSDRLFGAQCFLEPSLEHRVVIGIHPVCIHENINVDQDQATRP